MYSALQQAIIRGDRAGAESLATAAAENDGVALEGVVDQLLPFSLFQSNLRYGSFHAPKMQLFLRRLAREGCLSRPTQSDLARLLAAEMFQTRWIALEAAIPDYPEEGLKDPLSKMAEELSDHNLHNAFYYAGPARKRDPGLLVQTLLRLGAKHISRNLGHSLSCFYPIMSDLVAAGHPLADPGIFTYLLYLSRYPVQLENLEETPNGLPGEPGELLRRCASGSGIGNLHHMITFFILYDWNQASFWRPGNALFQPLIEWVDDKEPDRAREEEVERAGKPSALPTTYEEFQGNFRFDDLPSSLGLIFGLLDRDPRLTIDWIFRLYASHYNGIDWNPHYYTSLYAGIRLCRASKSFAPLAGKMALAQALEYFAAHLK